MMKYLFLVFFALAWSSVALAAGDSCDDPLSATEGANSASTLNGDQWFSFYSESGGDYYVEYEELHHLVVFNDCDTELEINEHYSRALLTIDAGQTILLKWKSDYLEKEFEFNFEIAEEGDVFEKPILISDLGAQTFPQDEKVAYYSYQSTAETVLEIDKKESAYASFFTEDGSSFDDPLYFLGQAYVSTETYIIRMEDEAGEAWDWELTSRGPIIGEYCSNPVVFSESATAEVSEKLSRTYFSYTATEDGKISVSNFSSYMIGIEFYDDCYGDNLDRDYDNTIEVVEGQTYILFCNNQNNSGSFTFTTNSSKGISCDVPIEIKQLGDVSFMVGSGSVFMSFVAPQTGTYMIDAPSVEPAGESSNQLSVYSGCDTYDYNGYIEVSYDKDLLFKANEGQSYIIVNSGNWEVANGEMLTLNIDINTVKGLACETPIQIEAAGEQKYDEDRDVLYYTYTPTKDCNLTVSDGDKQNPVEIYHDCDIEQGVYMTDGEASMTVKEGETVLIKWEEEMYESGGFTWTLTEAELAGGEMCAKPSIIETLGTIAFDMKANKVFYSYTATKDGFLDIADQSDYSNYVYILDECDGQEKFGNTDGNTRINVTEGQNVIIVWEDIDEYDTEWTLTESEGEAGESCAKPIALTGFDAGKLDVTIEANKVNYYSYTPAVNEVLIYQAEFSIGFKIADECITVEPNQKDIDSVSLIAGTEYIIAFNSGSQNADVSLTIREAIMGENVDNPIILTGSGTVAYESELPRLHYQYVATEMCVVECGFNYDELSPSVGFPVTMQKGETLNFDMKKQKDDVSFEFTIRDVVEGESCMKPFIGSIGENEFSGGVERLTVSYTAESDGIVTVSTDAEKSIMKMDSCNASYYINNDNILSFEAKKGQQFVLFVNLDKTEEFIFTIEENAAEAGETFSNPIEVVEGINKYVGSDKGLLKTYYKYVANGEPTLTIAGGGEWTYVVNAETGDTVASNMYDGVEFDAVYKTEYIIIQERASYHSDEWELTINNNGPEKFDVSITVSSADGVVAGATVTVGEKTATTNAEGIASFYLLDGTYNCSVSIGGKTTSFDEISVAGANLTKVLEVKTAEEGDVEYKLTLTDGDIKLENATIAINGAEYTADADGNVAIDLPTGTYSYTVTTEAGKKFSGTITIDGAGEAELDAEDHVVATDDVNVAFVVKPNPVQTTLSVVVPDDCIAKLFNSSGLLVYQTAGSFSVDVSNFPAGIYSVVTVVNGEVLTKKIVKK